MATVGVIGGLSRSFLPAGVRLYVR